jgi:hypothetical protein
LLIGRLVTDPLFRRRFEDDAFALLQELSAQGYELSAVEIEAFATIDAESIRTFAGALDGRLRKIDRASHPRHSHD